MRITAVRDSARCMPHASLHAGRFTEQQRLSPSFALLRRLHTSYSCGKNERDGSQHLHPGDMSEHLWILSQAVDGIVASKGPERGPYNVAKLRPQIEQAVDRMRSDIDEHHFALRAPWKATPLTWRHSFEHFYESVSDHVEDPRVPHSDALSALHHDFGVVNRALICLDEAKKARPPILDQTLDGVREVDDSRTTLDATVAEIPSVNANSAVLLSTSNGEAHQQASKSKSDVGSALEEHTDAFYKLIGNVAKPLFGRAYDAAIAGQPKAALPEQLSEGKVQDAHRSPAVVTTPLAKAVPEESTALATKAVVHSGASDDKQQDNGNSSAKSDLLSLCLESYLLSEIKEQIDAMVRDSSPEVAKKHVRDRPLNFEGHMADGIASRVTLQLEFMLSDIWGTRSSVFGDTRPPEVDHALAGYDYVQLGYCRKDICGVGPDFARSSLAEGVHGYVKHLQGLVDMIYQASPDTSDPQVAEKVHGCVRRIEQTLEALEGDLDSLRNEFFVN